MEGEIAGREPVVEQVKKTGQDMVENGHYASDTITSRLANLDNKWASARDTAAYRKRKLQDSLSVQQVSGTGAKTLPVLPGQEVQELLCITLRYDKLRYVTIRVTLRYVT